MGLFIMACTCVVGLQWGDEAKGKIVDLLTEQHDFVVRYNGGANAGHTVVSDGKTYKLSLLPTGILKPHLRSVIGNGVVVYPLRFLEEVDNLRQAGIAVGAQSRWSAIMPTSSFPITWKKNAGASRAARRQAIGTTGRGIGPCYQDKVGRASGIRVGELLHPEHLRQRLRAIVHRKNRLLRALSPEAKQLRRRCLAARVPRLRREDAAVHHRHGAPVAPGPASKASASCSRPPREACSTSITAPIRM